LFLAYVNDIWRNTESNVRLFADECIIYRKVHDTSDIDKLQRDLNKLGEWALENEMKIKPGKSKAVSFTKARVKEQITYYTGDWLIPEANNFIYLGNHTQQSKLGRSCKLYTTKSMEDPSFHNAYTQKGK
jgi:hypothetical protein